MNGILIEEYNGHKIYQDADKFIVTDKNLHTIGTSNCIEGARIVATLGKQGCDDLFPKKRGKRRG